MKSIPCDPVFAACDPELMPTFPEHRNLKRRSDQHENKSVDQTCRLVV